VAKTSDMLDRAFEEGLTGHVFRERAGKTVTLDDGTAAVEFISCSYLGLEQHPALVEAAHEAMDRCGLHFSSSQNRMRPPYLGQLEAALAEIYDGSRVLCFTSVSNVHLGILPLLGGGALPSYPVGEAGPAFLIDRTAHASMQVLRGIMEQLGPVSRFDRADLDSLTGGLQTARSDGRTAIVLVDGVGSMGGLIDVVALHACVAEASGYLYVDDAHGISIDGGHGAGYAATAFAGPVPSDVVLAGSLSKAFGGAGGFVVVPGPADVAVARKLANPLVFGHSIMLPTLAADVAAARLHLDGQVAGLQAGLWENAALFDTLTGHRLENAGLRSPIRGASFDSEHQALEVARRLRTAGILILPAFFPTVAQGTGLIRFAVSASHEPEHLRRAAAVLAP